MGELLGRTLVIVPHPDDECLAFGTLLQRMKEPLVVFVTDGAPLDPYFWKAYGSRENYARLRREEARAALAHVGVSEIEFLGAFQDQELYLQLDDAHSALRHLIERMRPEALATLAYEGGHPDHDSCNLLTAELGRELGIPAWEAPLYHRSPGNPDEHVVQDFVERDGREVLVEGTAAELERKRAMCGEYPSQGDFLKTFKAEREVVRPMHAYDYTRPPHAGQLNYEAWQWPMTGIDVCREFSRYLGERSRKQPARQVAASHLRRL